MKNRLSKIISSLLILAFLVSCFAVFAFAAEDDGTVEAPNVSEITLLYNRNFEEGWDFNNGLSAGSEKNNKFFIDHEETSDYSYNYFLRVQAENVSDGFTQFSFNTFVQKTNGTVIKLSIKADDYPNLGRILYCETGAREVFSLLRIQNGHLYAQTDKTDTTKLYDLGELTNEWMDIALVFDWDQDDYTCTYFFGKDYGSAKTVSLPYKTAGDKGLRYLRLGMEAGAAERIGGSYCIDNLQIYNNSKHIYSNEELARLGTGELVSDLASKTIDIMTGSGNKTAAQLLTEALIMKVGVDYALVKDVKTPIYDGTYGAPAKVNGKVMIPVDLLLDYIGFPSYEHGISYDITTGTSATYITIGRDTATVDGNTVQLSCAPGYVTDGEKSYFALALDDIETLFPGWLVTYDDMGLIIIYEDLTPDNAEDNGEIINRNTDLETMITLMKKFIYDTITTDENGIALKQDAVYNATGLRMYNDTKANTNNFDHPYIGASQETFDKLFAIYNANEGDEDYDAKLRGYLYTLIQAGVNFYNMAADLDTDGSYRGIKAEYIPQNEYSDGKDDIPDTTDGYDPDGGRLNSIGTHTGRLTDLAFAYQITGDLKYAELAYDWTLALGQWSHWGPGHFLNCAEAASSAGLAYDWLYDAYYELYGQAGVETIAKILFDFTVHEGYISSTGAACEHPRNLGDGSRYHTSNSNWNAVCSQGMTIATLAIMGSENYESTYAAEGNYLIGNNFINLTEHGLDEYAPDGSYIESASYWEYGTNAFFRMVMALTTAAGTDYGLMNTWGIDKTCYYACQIESSDGRLWNYHDGGGDGVTSSSGLGRQGTHMFNFVGKVLGDEALIALRQQQLEAGLKNISIYDMLFYPFDKTFDKVELTLDYHMDGIDAFVSRSSWEKGAMYTGLMGGMNNCSHGQIDSGNFIYHNKGVVWFMDLGSEQYNAYQYFGASRNKYYRANAEGQNVVFLTSDPTNVMYGQFSGAGGDITDTYINEHGSYAILDNTSVYAGNAIAAKRGILVTNDRETVVIQDEIVFPDMHSIYWVAHTAQYIEIDSNNGRVAYMTATANDGTEYTLRATIASQNLALRFKVISAEDTILKSATASSNYSVANGGVAEYSRQGIQRLAIEANNIIGFRAAVVIEMVEGIGSTQPTGYSYTEMYNWEPKAKQEYSDLDVNKRGPQAQADIRTATGSASLLFDKKTAFTEKLATFYDNLALVAYTAKKYDKSILSGAVLKSYKEYEDLLEEYEKYREMINEKEAATHSFFMNFAGFPTVTENEG